MLRQRVRPEVAGSMAGSGGASSKRRRAVWLLDHPPARM